MTLFARDKRGWGDPFQKKFKFNNKDNSISYNDVTAEYMITLDRNRMDYFKNPNFFIIIIMKN